jgi:hypothetical protein
MNQIDKRIESAKTIQTNRRNYRRARDRALARLAGIYREQYLELLEQERAEDAKNGKTWLDISGRTHLDIALDRAAHDSGSLFRSPETDADPEDEGDLGGKE